MIVLFKGISCWESGRVFTALQLTLLPLLPVKLYILEFLAFLVESMRRRSIGWVGRAAQGCKCTNLHPQCRFYRGSQNMTCRRFFSVMAWIMTTHWKEDMVYDTMWLAIFWHRRIPRGKETRSTIQEKSVPKKKNWFRLTCPKLDFFSPKLL